MTDRHEAEAIRLLKLAQPAFCSLKCPSVFSGPHHPRHLPMCDEMQDAIGADETRKLGLTLSQMCSTPTEVRLKQGTADLEAGPAVIRARPAPPAAEGDPPATSLPARLDGTHQWSRSVRAPGFGDVAHCRACDLFSFEAGADDVCSRSRVADPPRADQAVPLRGVDPRANPRPSRRHGTDPGDPGCPICGRPTWVRNGPTACGAGVCPELARLDQRASHDPPREEGGQPIDAYTIDVAIGVAKRVGDAAGEDAANCHFPPWFREAQRQRAKGARHVEDTLEALRPANAQPILPEQR